MEYNHKVDTTGKFSKRDIKRLISIYTENTKTCDDIDIGKCNELKQSNIECPINCVPSCTNHVVRNCKWLKTYVLDKGSKQGFGLFSTERIEKDKFIMEYTGEIKSKEKTYIKYAMEMEKHSIDEYNKGSKARYINSLDTPNA